MALEGSRWTRSSLLTVQLFPNYLQLQTLIITHYTTQIRGLRHITDVWCFKTLHWARLLYSKTTKSPCLFSKWIIIKLLAGSGSSLTGLGFRIVSHLPANLSQEPQHRVRGLKRADFRGSVWTGEALAHNKVRPPTKREKQWPGRSDRRRNSALGWSEYAAGV